MCTHLSKIYCAALACNHLTCICAFSEAQLLCNSEHLPQALQDLPLLAVALNAVEQGMPLLATQKLVVFHMQTLLQLMPPHSKHVTKVGTTGLESAGDSVSRSKLRSEHLSAQALHLILVQKEQQPALVNQGKTTE